MGRSWVKLGQTNLVLSYIHISPSIDFSEGMSQKICTTIHPTKGNYDSHKWAEKYDPGKLLIKLMYHNLNKNTDNLLTYK